MRARMITRTIKSVKATILTYNIVTKEMNEIGFTLPSTVDNNELAIMDYARKYYETEKNRMVSLVNSRTEEKIYGMPEARFMELAKELDFTTRKAIEEDIAEQSKEDAQEDAQEDGQENSDK